MLLPQEKLRVVFRSIPVQMTTRIQDMVNWILV
jgi:hypothetical protein